MQPAEPADVRSIAEPWISVDHVAAHLGVSIDSLYRWIANRALPAHHRIGRLWKFKVSEVDAWVRADGVNTSSRQD